MGANITKKSNKTDSTNIKSYGNAHNQSSIKNKSFFLMPTNYFEISKIINNLKGKTGGVDKISSKILKSLSIYISVPLEYIFNLCIYKSIWPSALKESEIVPIHKSGSKYCTTNYRPISLISNIAKIFEKIIHNRLIKFFKDTNIISKWQYGFLKNKGTKDALNYVTHNIYSNLDKNNVVIAAFLDLSKAFDTICHKSLLYKLYNCGIRGPVLSLIQSYLSGRKQSVRFLNGNSSKRDIISGVPQGTILGPLFFILYINCFCFMKIIN